MNPARRANRATASADDPEVVAVGRHVEIELVDRDGGRERVSLDVVPQEKADYAAGRLGCDTPLATALLGQRTGTSLPYCVGDLREVRILSVGPAQGTPHADAVNRQAVLARAISRSEQAEAARFSLTVDLKWGGTDPSALEERWE